MEIPDDQTDQASLLLLTAEAVGLLASGNFDALANRFGYALAYGRDRSARSSKRLVKPTSPPCFNKQRHMPPPTLARTQHNQSFKRAASPPRDLGIR
jgi:hypothetical protein